MTAFQDTGNTFSRSTVPKLNRIAAEDRTPAMLDPRGKDTPAGSYRAMLDAAREFCQY